MNGKHGFYVAILLVIFAHVTHTLGPVCYTCDRLPHPWDCDTVTQCNTHEECFVEQAVTVSGNIVYTSGCAPPTKCRSSKRHIESSHDVDDVTDAINDVMELEDDVITCTKCCNDSSYCNHELCDYTTQTPHPGRQYCLYCANVLSPDDCEHVVLCDVNEICFTEYVILNGERRYRLGCSPRESCELTDVRHTVPQLIGRKRDLLVNTSPYCGKCCEGMNCNGALCTPGSNNNNNGGAYELVTSPSRNDLCTDVSTVDCLYDIKVNSSVCNDPGYYNYACRKSCRTCASTGPPIDPTDCFYDSTRYMGQRLTTLSGKTCLAWSTIGRDDDSLTNAGNHCRDPDGRGYPWCYISTSGDWEYCKVPYCPECHYPEQSGLYNGYVFKDINGQDCVPWTDYVNQPGITTANMNFPDGSPAAAMNYCRDVYNNGSIVCFNGNRLTACNVPVCTHTCRDNPETFTDCALVEQFVCKNEYNALTLCPKTCNMCNFGLLPQVSVKPQETCLDVPEANCAAIESFICVDDEASVRLCPRTCNKCNTYLSTPALTTSTSQTPIPTNPVGTTPIPTNPVGTTPIPTNPSVQTSNPTDQTTQMVTTDSPPTTNVPATWLEWGEWSCSNVAGNCFHARYRNCSDVKTNECHDGKPYEINSCEKNSCVICEDYHNENGNNGCHDEGLPFICAITSIAWQTCRKSCNLCDTCWDYLDCSSQKAKDFYCSKDEFSTKYCRKTCNKCEVAPVDVPLSSCGDPVATDETCEGLQKDICICSDNDLKDLCKNFCNNKCADHPFTVELHNCTIPTKRKRDAILSELDLL